MGAFGAKGDEFTDKINRDSIEPYRMAQIMKTAADITDRLVSGKYLYGANYQECEIVVGLIEEAIRKCKEGEHVSEQDKIQKDDEGSL